MAYDVSVGRVISIKSVNEITVRLLIYALTSYEQLSELKELAECITLAIIVTDVLKFRLIRKFVLTTRVECVA